MMNSIHAKARRRNRAACPPPAQCWQGRLTGGTASMAQWLRYFLMANLILLLGGCLAPQLKPPADKLAALGRILVVPVEAPPLEVYPDPISEEMPGYGENIYENLPLSATLTAKPYKRPGGVIMVGLAEDAAVVPAPAPQHLALPAGTTGGMQSLAALREAWLPSLVVAQQAVTRLNTARHRALLGSHMLLLPLADEQRNAYLGHWHGAIRRWYNGATSSVDYRQLAAGRADVVLEVGVGAYRIFYGQISLQILLKLVDPVTGQVFGRVDVKDYKVGDSLSALLGDEAVQFKAAISEIGAALLSGGLNELGLTRAARQSEAVAPSDHPV